MYFVFTLGSHEAFGPFTSRERAHLWARSHVGAYQVLVDGKAQQYCETASLRLVPLIDR